MGKFIDLTGQQFGEWTVLEYAGNGKWLCQCSCENKTQREVLGKTLKNGASKSCGCLHKVNIEGKIFGNWQVIKQTNHMEALCKCRLCNEMYSVKIANLKNGSTTKCVKCSRKEQIHAYEDLTDRLFGLWKPIKYEGNQKWLCECQCENKTKKVVSAGDLKRGKTKSCGCMQFRDLTKENLKANIIKYIDSGYWKCKCINCGKEYIAYRTDILNGKDNCGCMTLNKRKETMLNRYGDISTSKIGNARTLEQQLAVQDKENLASFIIRNFEYKPSIYELSLELNLSADRTLKLIHKYNLDNLVLINAGSHFEDEIYTELKNILDDDIEIIRHDRTCIKPKELDFYIPKYKVAIEFNGNYWHSSAVTDKYSHRSKSIACAQQGIQLIHIFEYEWVNNKQKIISLLKQKLTSDKVIYARNTIIKEIDKNEAEKFCNNIHLQNWASSKVCIGCFYN